MKKNNVPIWGIALVLVGVMIALKSMGFFDVNFFFWVSLFIVIPCFIGLFNNQTGKLGYLIGICVGAAMMFSSLGIIRWSMFVPLGIAAVLIVIGIKSMVGHNNKTYTDIPNGQPGQQTGNDTQNAYYQTDGSNQEMNGSGSSTYYGSGNNGYTYQETGYPNNMSNQSFGGSANTNTTGGPQRAEGTFEGYRAYSAVFSGREIRFDNEPFHGCMLSAVFGGIELNLRNAILTHDVNIDVKTTFAGIDIFVPRNARVIVNCSPVLGNCDNQTYSSAGMINCPTIYINATCVLGGVDVNY